MGRAIGAALTAVMGTASASAAQPDAPLTRRALGADSVIDGIPCSGTDRPAAEWHRNGRLAGCRLSRDLARPPHRFTVGTWLDFDRTGVLWGAWLDRDTPLSGLRCKGEGYKKWSVRFHPNGTVAECRVAHDTVIAGIPCLRGTFWNELRGGGRTAVWLTAAGDFRQCQVARDTTVDGVALRRWQVAARGRDGKVQLVR